MVSTTFAYIIFARIIKDRSLYCFWQVDESSWMPIGCGKILCLPLNKLARELGIRSFGQLYESLSLILVIFSLLCPYIGMII